MENKDLKNEQRKRALTHLITEAVVLSLWEQDQAQIPPSPPAASAPPTSTELQAQTNSGVPQVPSQPSNPSTELQAQQITLDLLINKFNIIRGGKSFTDPEVYGQMVTKFKELQDQEKTTIYNYLNDVSKMISFANQDTTEQAPPDGSQNPTEPSVPSPVAPPVQQAPMGAAPSPAASTPVSSPTGAPIQPTGF